MRLPDRYRNRDLESLGAGAQSRYRPPPLVASLRSLHYTLQKPAITSTSPALDS